MSQHLAKIPPLFLDVDLHGNAHTVLGRRRRPWDLGNSFARWTAHRMHSWSYSPQISRWTTEETSDGNEDSMQSRIIFLTLRKKGRSRHPRLRESQGGVYEAEAPVLRRARPAL